MFWRIWKFFKSLSLGCLRDGRSAVSQTSVPSIDVEIDERLVW